MVFKMKTKSQRFPNLFCLQLWLDKRWQDGTPALNGGGHPFHHPPSVTAAKTQVGIRNEVSTTVLGTHMVLIMQHC